MAKLCSFIAAALLGNASVALCGPPEHADGESWVRKAELTVLPEPAREMMQDYLTHIVDQMFEKRSATLAKLRTSDDWERRAEFVRQRIVDWTGPLPERTPLNAKTTGRIIRDGYVVEKVLFESRPGFVVSANLYLPTGGLSGAASSEKLPAVLNVIGHSMEGKAAEKVQQRSIAQAQKGFVALTIDGIGQGERQISDYAVPGGSPSQAHKILGGQAFLAGTHLFNWMVWDAIRAVDYLVTRPEVDPTRIACTGCSGGGMMTTYLLPFEPRIAVAVPACNPNTWSHRVHAGLPCDHEQVFYGAFAAGVDPRGDPLVCHVPKPLLINATTDDNLNPSSGVWELSSWLERAYAAYDAPQQFKTTMVQAPHGYNLEQRELAYSWMLKWSGGDSANFHEGDLAIERIEDTWCTDSGNVYSSGISRDPQELILDHLQIHHAQWPKVTRTEDVGPYKQRMKQNLVKLLSLPVAPSVPSCVVHEAKQIGDIRVTSIELQPEAGIVLPGVWLESASPAPDAPVILYLHDEGKTQLVQASFIKDLIVTGGFRLLAVDLRGVGETAPGLETKFWDFLIGRAIFTQRVGDVRSILHWLPNSDVPSGEITIWAQGVSALCAAMAVAVDDLPVRRLILEQPPLSFESIATQRIPAYNQETLVPGILEHLDMPQVYQSVYPAELVLINLSRGDGQAATPAQVEQSLGEVGSAFESLGSSRSWRVLTGLDDVERNESIRNALIRKSNAR